jgi:hypothetical protein
LAAFLSSSVRESSRGAAAIGALSLLLILLLLGLARPARGNGPVQTKQGAFLEKKGQLRVSVGFRDMLNSELRRKLRSGFPTTVVMRIYLYQRAGDPPVAFTARTLKAVYDLWDEQYVLSFEEPWGKSIQRLQEEKAVVDRLTSLWQFPLVNLTRLEINTQYFVAIIAEVNPMGEALLEEVRRWLRNPYSEHRPSSGESFFGSFVSIFINNKIRSADQTYTLATQPFYRRP